MAMINFPFGIKMSQSYNELGFWMEFICRNKVKAFVELGVHVGGLAAMMISYEWWNPERFSYLGVEHIEHGINPLVRKRGTFFISDVFEDTTRDGVMGWMRERGPTIIYCDNGQKNEELEIYAPICRPGDYIFAHDWQSEVFEADVEFLVQSPVFRRLDNVSLSGTTLIGFERI
jgi:hypothetical protein